MRKLVALTALLGAVGCLTAGSATAAGLSPPVADCDTHGYLKRSYSAAELRNALATMPADVSEYTNCHDVIQRALLAKLGKLADAGGSGGGSFLPTWLLVVLILLLLGGAGLGAVALRNRRTG
jgi:hypothetical protein